MNVFHEVHLYDLEAAIADPEGQAAADLVSGLRRCQEAKSRGTTFPRAREFRPTLTEICRQGGLEFVDVLLKDPGRKIYVVQVRRPGPPAG